MIKRKILRFVLAVLIITELGIIFSLSAQKAEASAETSSSFIENIVRILNPDFDSWDSSTQADKVESLQGIVRTFAHFCEYGLLGVLSCSFLLTFDGIKRAGLIAWAFSTVFAVTDEIHQLFVEGRSFQLSDIAVDSAGAALGAVVLIFLICKIKKICKKHIIFL